MKHMRAHEDAEERSRRLHIAVADRLAADPSLVERARERTARWLADGSVAAPYAQEWARLLAEPLPRLLEALGERTDRMHDLRQVSPFAGVLDARTRWRVRRSAPA